MNKKIFGVLGLIITIITVLPLSTVLAAKPTVNDDVCFVAAPAGYAVGGETWWTGDGTVKHMKGYSQSWEVFRSPPGAPGTIQIGSMATMMETFVFNTKTSKGRFVYKVTISLTETELSLNPYGVGTFEGTLVVEVTSLHPVVGFPGDGTGFVVAMHGTGAFENAKLTADVLMMPGPPAMPGVFIFFGTQEYVNGRGIIVYH